MITAACWIQADFKLAVLDWGHVLFISISSQGMQMKYQFEPWRRWDCADAIVSAYHETEQKIRSLLIVIRKWLWMFLNQDFAPQLTHQMMALSSDCKGLATINLRGCTKRYWQRWAVHEEPIAPCEANTAGRFSDIFLPVHKHLTSWHRQTCLRECCTRYKAFDAIWSVAYRQFATLLCAIELKNKGQRPCFNSCRYIDQ